MPKLILKERHLGLNPNNMPMYKPLIKSQTHLTVFNSVAITFSGYNCGAVRRTDFSMAEITSSIYSLLTMLYFINQWMKIL